MGRRGLLKSSFKNAEGGHYIWATPFLSRPLLTLGPGGAEEKLPSEVHDMV